MIDAQKIIPEFKGEYDFLSNFYVIMPKFKWGGDEWLTVEHAFQAAKMDDPVDYFRIRDAVSPSLAKKYGREGKMVEKWEEVKLAIMEQILRAKFTVDELKAKLLATGDAALVEGNWWKDAYWGVCLRTGAGENHLGKILMAIREDLRK